MSLSSRVGVYHLARGYVVWDLVANQLLLDRDVRQIFMVRKENGLVKGECIRGQMLNDKLE